MKCPKCKSNHNRKDGSVKGKQKIKVVELDEMHTWISPKKIIAGSGLLLIEMGKNSSTAYRVPGEPKPDKSSGIPLETRK